MHGLLRKIAIHIFLLRVYKNYQIDLNNIEFEIMFFDEEIVFSSKPFLYLISIELNRIIQDEFNNILIMKLKIVSN